MQESLPIHIENIGQPVSHDLVTKNLARLMPFSRNPNSDPLQGIESLVVLTYFIHHTKCTGYILHVENDGYTMCGTSTCKY